MSTPNHRFNLLLLTLVTCALFTPATMYGFVNWDDPWLVTRNPLLRDLDLQSLWHIFNPAANRDNLGSQYTPLSDLLYALEIKVFGLQPAFFHLQSLLWHLTAVLLTYAVLFALYARRSWALLGAGVLAVHPLSVEVAVWISGRRTAMCFVFMLAAMWAWERYHRSGKTSAIVWSLIAAVAANMCKQTAIVVPALLFLVDRRWDLCAPPRRPSARYLLTHLAIALVFVSIATWVGFREGVLVSTAGAHADMLVRNLVAVGASARMLLAPTALGPVYGFDFPTHGAYLSAIASGSVVVLTGTLATVLAWRRAPVIGFCLAATVLLFAPSLSPGRSQLVADRYLYGCLPFLAVALAAALDHLPDSIDIGRTTKVRGTSIGWVVVGLLLCSLTTTQVPIWRNSVALWSHALAQRPDNPVILRQLGLALIENNRLDEAEVVLETAAQRIGRLADGRGRAAQAQVQATLDAVRTALGKDPRTRAAAMKAAARRKELEGQEP